MSNYKLTEKNVEMLKLMPVTWDTVRKNNIEQVFIRAHEDAAMYGPYLVQDPLECEISRLDGSSPSIYPRDKGLYVKKSDLPKSKGAWTISTFDKRSVLKDMLDSVKKDIAVAQAQLDKLKRQEAALEETLNG